MAVFGFRARYAALDRRSEFRLEHGAHGADIPSFVWNIGRMGQTFRVSSGTWGASGRHCKFRLQHERHGAEIPSFVWNMQRIGQTLQISFATYAALVKNVVFNRFIQRPRIGLETSH